MEDKKILTLDEIEEKQVSRRDFLSKSGKVSVALAGSGILSSIYPGCKKDEKKDEPAATVFTTTPGTGGDGVVLLKYRTADQGTVGQNAYDSWFTTFCTMAVVKSIVDELRTSLGEVWNDFPVIATKWGHGGGVGWGTICGTLTGAAYIISMVAGKTPGEAMINDLMNYYSATAMPDYTPTTQNAAGTATTTQTTSNSPLCHVSVSKWMMAAGVTFSSKERKDRCARLTAAIARKAVEMLNGWAATGAYTAQYMLQLTKTTDSAEAVHKSATARPAQTKAGCNDCHGATLAIMQ